MVSEVLLAHPLFWSFHPYLPQLFLRFHLFLLSLVSLLPFHYQCSPTVHLLCRHQCLCYQYLLHIYSHQKHFYLHKIYLIKSLNHHIKSNTKLLKMLIYFTSIMQQVISTWIKCLMTILDLNQQQPVAVFVVVNQQHKKSKQFSILALLLPILRILQTNFKAI